MSAWLARRRLDWERLLTTRAEALGDGNGNYSILKLDQPRLYAPVFFVVSSLRVASQGGV